MRPCAAGIRGVHGFHYIVCPAGIARFGRGALQNGPLLRYTQSRLGKGAGSPVEFSISQMAQMHGITRQTLIYYDKIGLFCPARTDGSGARFYTAEQMPVLREICMLKRLDVPLKEIRQALMRIRDAVRTL